MRIQNKRKFCKAGELAQLSAHCTHFRPEVWSLVSRLKGRAVWCKLRLPTAGSGDGRIPGVSWPDSLANSRFNDSPISQSKRLTEGDTHTYLCPPHICTSVCTDACTHMSNFLKNKHKEVLFEIIHRRRVYLILRRQGILELAERFVVWPVSQLLHFFFLTNNPNPWSLSFLPWDLWGCSWLLGD